MVADALDGEEIDLIVTNQSAALRETHLILGYVVAS
jgi:hypothetical protein